MRIKDDVYKAIEEAREEKIIGKSLEAQVLLNCSAEDKQLLQKLFSKIAQTFIVSDFSFTDEELTAYDVCQVKVLPAEGDTCPRCWNVTKSDHPDKLCSRCQEILQ